MFGEFHGLPVHALVLHAAVLFAPLAAVTCLAYLVPKLRRWLRWPMVVIVLAALGTVFVATQSGAVLRKAMGTQLIGTMAGDLITRHERLGQRLLIALVILFVLAVAAAVTQPRAARLAGHLIPVVLAGTAVVVFVLTYQTGEAGAKATWNPSGSMDYSGR